MNTAIVNHWLTEAIAHGIPGGDAMTVRRCLVIHFTAGATAESSINFWRTSAARGACAHLVIDRDGTTYQCRPFNRTAGHAGVSRWRDPKTGTRYEQLNHCSIGIELANVGCDTGAMGWARRQAGFGSIHAAHLNGGEKCEWEHFPSQQLITLAAISAALVRSYKLDDVTGHDCIAPERKNDPGPAFPMQWLREQCGFKGLPAVHRP